jgi:hypothetical protein
MKKNFMLILCLGLIMGMSIAPGYGDTIALAPVSDIYVSATDNSWDDSWLVVEAGLFYGIDQRCRTYLQFDLSAVPSGSTITDASLTLHSVNVGRKVDYDLYHVLDDSNIKTNMTWGTQPLTGSVPLDSLAVDYSNVGSNTWNLLELGNWDFASDLSDGLLSLQLRVRDENTTNYCYLQFRSLNYGTDYPLLTLDYTNAASPVPIPGAVLLLGAGMIRLGLRIKKLRS